MLNSYTKLLLTMIFGLILGYLLRATIIQNSDNYSPHLVNVQDRQVEQKQVKLDTVALEKVTIDSTEPRLESADVRVKTSLLDVQGILDYLAGFKSDDYESYSKARAKVRERFDEFPEQGFEMLEALLDLEDGDVKHQLRLALWTSKLNDDGSLESWLVERIETGDRAGERLQLMGMWGVQSRAGLDSVLGQLANNPDPVVISASMRILNTTLNNYPLAISPNQRKDLGNQLRLHLSSTDENLRRAALVSLAEFPQDDMAEIVLNAFDDPSAKVRVSAVNSYNRKPFPSADIRSRVITGLQDSSRSYMERSAFADTALSLDLSDDEQTLVRNFQGEAQAYFSGLTAEEIRSLSNELE